MNSLKMISSLSEHKTKVGSHLRLSIAPPFENAFLKKVNH